VSAIIQEHLIVSDDERIVEEMPSLTVREDKLQLSAKEKGNTQCQCVLKITKLRFYQKLQCFSVVVS